MLPLVRISSRLFGRRLVSMPFLDYGGVLAEPERGAETALVEEALAAWPVSAALTGSACDSSIPSRCPTRRPSDRVTMLLELTNEEAMWKALPSERRNRVRKGEKLGLTAILGRRRGPRRLLPRCTR